LTTEGGTGGREFLSWTWYPLAGALAAIDAWVVYARWTHQSAAAWGGWGHQWGVLFVWCIPGALIWLLLMLLALAIRRRWPTRRETAKIILLALELGVLPFASVG